MKREFSFRVFLDRSERNAAQEKAEKVGILKMPALFRFALEKLDADLADEILRLKEDLAERQLQVDDLQQKLKIANSTAVMHENNAGEWSVSYLAVQSELREKIAEYEQMKAESAEYERKWQEQSKRADTFEQNLELTMLQLTELQGKYDERHADWLSLRLEIDKIAECVGCPGAKINSIAPRVAEIKAARDKYHPAFLFMTHEFALDANQIYNNKHFHDTLEALFGVIADYELYKEHDAHLRFGLRISNVVARYKNRIRTERDYFELLCHRLNLDIEKPHSLCDFERAFDALKVKESPYLVRRLEKIESEYEDIRSIFREVYHQLYYVSVFSIMWDRIKRFFSRDRVKPADMVMYEQVGEDSKSDTETTDG